MDNGLLVSDIWVLNTDSCGTTEFSAAAADITEAAGLSSGPYIDNGARRVIACRSVSAQPPREHFDGVCPAHPPWRGLPLSTGLGSPVHPGG
jgi:hypothetical protein